MKAWKLIKAPNIPQERLDSEAEALGVPPLVLRLLYQRGLKNAQEADVFFSPWLKHLAHPEQWQGMKESADILEQAVLDRKKIAVWGDYDVDGITAATLVQQVLDFHLPDDPVTVYLPDRRKEGYGLNIAGIESLAAQGIQVLLTVDCGISNVEAVRKAKDLGMTVVISDHHLSPAHLPAADAIVDPRVCPWKADPATVNPCPHLAGVGVAFYLMADLNGRLNTRTGRKMDMRETLDLVALGTLADVVALTGQNRILVKNGLLKIAEAKRPGLAALKRVSGFYPVSVLRSGQVVFHLAPRINAAGRLGNPKLAHDLLCASDLDQAAELAEQLNALNNERRAEEEKISAEAYKQAERFQDKAGIVLYGEQWHPGIIGIVASRMVEKLERPVLVLCGEGPILKGSGRTVGNFNLYDGLCRCADFLTTFGGHKMAAGLSLPLDLLEAFRERFNTVVLEELKGAPLVPTLNIDAKMPFAEATNYAVLKALELLQPFGMGNAEPVFSSEPLIVRSCRAFGKTKEHLMLDVCEEKSGLSLKAKGWNLYEKFPQLEVGKKFWLAFVPKINDYSGVPSIELEIRDWHSCEAFPTSPFVQQEVKKEGGFFPKIKGISAPK